MRTIENLTTAKGHIEVKYDHVDREYRVEVYRGGKLYTPATYFTDDKSDALGTAKKMVEEEGK